MSVDIDFSSHWDGLSQAWLQSFDGRWKTAMSHLLADLAYEFGTEGVAFIKPQVRGNGYWQPSTGATERGIGYEVTKSSDGFVVNFVGTNMSKGGKRPRNIADMIDVGNFDKNTLMTASSVGLRAFPISARAGNVQWLKGGIHGMGYTSPEYPKRFSEKGVKELHSRVPQIAEDPLQSFLDELVSNVIP
jgi:hypothetical protein